jgi:hypothetical protein
MVFQSIECFLKVLWMHNLWGPATFRSRYYRVVGLPFPLPMVTVVTRGILMLVGIMLGLQNGGSHNLDSHLVDRTPKGLK